MKVVRFKDIRERLDREPFRPFQIRLSDGRSFKVVRRDLCILTDRAVYVGVPDPKIRGIVKRVDSCPYDYAVGIEELNVKNSPRSTRGNDRNNGRSKGKS